MIKKICLMGISSILLTNTAFATNTNTMEVKANITGGCLITSNDVIFGSLETNHAITGSSSISKPRGRDTGLIWEQTAYIQVTCSTNLPYTIHGQRMDIITETARDSIARTGVPLYNSLNQEVLRFMPFLPPSGTRVNGLMFSNGIDYNHNSVVTNTDLITSKGTGKLQTHKYYGIIEYDVRPLSPNRPKYGSFSGTFSLTVNY